MKYKENEWTSNEMHIEICFLRVSIFDYKYTLKRRTV